MIPSASGPALVEHLRCGDDAASWREAGVSDFARLEERMQRGEPTGIQGALATALVVVLLLGSLAVLVSRDQGYLSWSDPPVIVAGLFWFLYLVGSEVRDWSGTE